MAMHALLSIRQRTRGQSMVEFALILPLLIAFVFGIIQLGILFSVYVGMTNSAREAARAGSVYQYGGVPFTENTTANIQTVDDVRRIYISQIITSTINPLVDPTTGLTSTVTYTPTTPLTPYRAGDTISVQLEHDHPLFFGLFGRQKITIRASSAMRIEPGATK
jgi:Flp pilus assembly protein TadG